MMTVLKINAQSQSDKNHFLLNQPITCLSMSGMTPMNFQSLKIEYSDICLASRQLPHRRDVGFQSIPFR
jgi:hypothetical protein